MITFFRSLIALALAGVLTVLTLGRVRLNRTGTSTATDDDDVGRRPAASQPLERRAGDGAAPDADERGPQASGPVRPKGPARSPQFTGATRMRR